MKPSGELLNKFMNQYLDEVRNFGDEEETLLCENLFNKTHQILLESSTNINGFKLLKEVASSKKEVEIVEDFKLYVKLILEGE